MITNFRVMEHEIYESKAIQEGNYVSVPGRLRRGLVCCVYVLL